MESISITDPSTAISDSIYEELSPEIQTGLKRVEAKDAFTEGTSLLKTVEIAIEILKNGQTRTVTKELYQHEWSWAKWGGLFVVGVLFLPNFAVALPAVGYQLYNRYCSNYAREKAENLIKRSIKELVLSEDFAKEDIVQCAIKVNTADQKAFNRGGYWFGLEDKQETLCDHTFRKVS